MGRPGGLLRFLLAAAGATGLGLALEAAGILNPFWIQILELGCVVAVSALGLNLIYGCAGLFSLGHAAFYGIGAYTAAALLKAWGGPPVVGFVPAVLAGGAAAALSGLLIGLPTLRLTSDYLGIATLGFGVIAKVVFDNSDAFLPLLGGARGMTGIARVVTLPWAVAFVVAAILVVRNLLGSSYGRAILAIREDEVAAAAMGIDVFRYKAAGFVTGCAFAGVAGGLYAHLYAFLHPSNFDFFKSIDLLVIVVLGGLGNMSGTLAASFGWIFLIEGLRAVLPPGLVELRWVLIPVLLIATMLLRPRGLFGGREIGFLRGGEER